jgi:hypothetical protein
VWSETLDYDFVFEGSAEQFPVNRGTTYDLERHSNMNFYGDYFFTSYVEATGSLVFRKFNGVDFDYCTITDTDDWTITTASVAIGS